MEEIRQRYMEETVQKDIAIEESPRQIIAREKYTAYALEYRGVLGRGRGLGDSLCHYISLVHS
jgi:hypothetical protein